MRFSLHGAIAPTATSGTIINATEGIDPVLDLFFIDEGTTTLPSLAYDIKNNRDYYVNSFNVGNPQLLKLAAIRQRFLDQSQSVNTYYKSPKSARELVDDLFLAMELGLKTLYYMKTPKEDGAPVDYVCEGCT